MSRGCSDNTPWSGEEGTELEPALLACYDIAGRTPKTRIVDSPRMGKGECAVVVDGFNVYAGELPHGPFPRRIGTEFGITRAGRSVGKAVSTTQ